MTLPYEETLRWFEGEIRGQTGAAVGGAIGGYPGSIQGREIAMGLNVDPWMPKWEPPKTVSVKGEVVALIGLSAEDGTLLDPVTGEPMDQARAEQAVRLLLGHTMDHLRGAGTVALDRALGELSGGGAALLGGAPDERLADATRPWTSDDPTRSMLFEFDEGTSRTDASPARSAPAPQPSLLEVLGSMYGGHVVPEPAEPPSIFDASVFGTGAPAAPAWTAPVSSAPAGAAGALAGSPFVAAPPPGGPSAPSGGVVTAPRVPGASGSGALYKPPAAPPRDPLRELWPPTPAGSLAELFDAVTPGRPQLPRGSAGAPRGGGDDPNDQGDLDRWAFDLALLGAVEAIPELLLATAKQMAKNALYLTPVGIPLAIHDINDLIDELSDAVDRNGGGVPGLLDALNERFNPLAGLVRNTVEAVEAHEDKDARKLGNRMFKLGIEVLGMAAVLRGGGKGGKAGAAEPRPVSRSGTPGGKPRGRPTQLHGSAENRRSLQRENEAARTLAEHGYDVEQNPGPRPNGKEPDYRIKGEYFDCYAPRSSNADAIRNRISEKVSKTQADRIVLSLEDSALTPKNIRDALDQKPITGLKEVLAIKDGNIERIFPSHIEGEF